MRERNSAGTLGAVSSLDRSYYVRTTPLLYEELRLLENRELGAFIQSLNSVEERVTGTGVELLSLIKRVSRVSSLSKSGGGHVSLINF